MHNPLTHVVVNRRDNQGRQKRPPRPRPLPPRLPPSLAAQSKYLALGHVLTTPTCARERQLMLQSGTRMAWIGSSPAISATDLPQWNSKWCLASKANIAYLCRSGNGLRVLRARCNLVVVAAGPFFNVQSNDARLCRVLLLLSGAASASVVRSKRRRRRRHRWGIGRRSELRDRNGRARLVMMPGWTGWFFSEVHNSPWGVAWNSLCQPEGRVSQIPLERNDMRRFYL